MTPATKPVWRMVHTARGDIAVAITSAGILIRRKGSHTTMGPVPITTIEDIAAKLEVAGRGIVVPKTQRRVRPDAAGAR
jgi:hypothetical protein